MNQSRSNSLSARPWRMAIGSVIVVFAGSLFCGIAVAAPKAEEAIPPRLDASVSKGLNFLAKQQVADGALDSGGPRVATTSLSILAFLATGQTPDVGKYGLVMRGAIDWLLLKQAADGYWGDGDRGMYSHAITTLALAQDYGVESSADRRKQIHASLTRAVAIILAAQETAKSNPIYAGGWRYERNSPDSDLSLSGWNVLALRAAQDVGIAVPDGNRKKAVEFVLRCMDPGTKGFAYQPGNPAQAGDTAIGILCLDMLEASDANRAAVAGALKYLQTHNVDPDSQFAYYATYYVTQAAFQQDGDAWTTFGRPSLERLMRVQDKDGGWPLAKGGQEPGRVYSTAMALGALTVPYRLLPVYQR